jgi:glycosyltransferase involved in cell wall biosynthesis
MQHPILSVIIPAYNRAETVGRAIASIAGNSRTNDVEIVVVDDGSTDDTADTAQQAVERTRTARGFVIRQKNAGPGAARNAAARAAGGQYLAFLDSDDFWLQGALDAALAAIRDSPERRLVFLQTIDLQEGDAAPLCPAEKATAHLYRSFTEAVAANGSQIRFASCNVIIEKRLFEELGGFTNEVLCSEDSDLFLRSNSLASCMTVNGPPLVAHLVDRGDHLTGNVRNIYRGLDFMLSRERAGYYPQNPPTTNFREQFLANAVAYAVLAAFANGDFTSAYRLYFVHLRRLAAGRNWHWLLRLPFMPLLGIIKPISYHVRWSRRPHTSPTKSAI